MVSWDPLQVLADQMRDELVERILPYWATRAVDEHHGGFVGRIAGDGSIVPAAPKGVVLAARILWSFAAAYHALGEERLRALAERAQASLETFWDPEFGGVYWMVDPHGRPVDERKHVYAQAFAVYALAEAHRATGNRDALDRAAAAYRLIEEHSADRRSGGYHEAHARDWSVLEDVRLSERDADEKKSLNTHLHLLEAYAGLYRVWRDSSLGSRLRLLLDLHLDRLFDATTGHFRLFCDEGWRVRGDAVSYGHDIEASWLILEAADVLGDAGLRARVREVSLAAARATLCEGLDEDGGVFNDGGPEGVRDGGKDWWPQAEAIVGFVSAYQESGDPAFAAAAARVWAFIRRRIVDPERGEWRWGVTRDGLPRDGEDKVGPWKCPYHNTRACLEVMARVSGSVR